MEKHSKENGRNRIRTPREMRLVWVLLVLSFWLVFNSSSFASESGKMKRVLILYSFRFGLSGNELMDANKITSSAIQATMEEEMAEEIAFHIERMNISALSENRYFEELRDAYRKKHDGLPIDLIIAVNNRALKFLISHGEELWPKTPILFCGVEKGRREQLKQLRPNITGLFADARFEHMLDTIFKIHPDTQQITVIVGASETESFIEDRVRRAFRKYVGRVDFTSLSNFGFDAILSRAADLPPNSIVLFLTLLQDGDGKPVPENALPLISRVSNVPVYGLFDVYVGHGIVGGNLYSVENRGIMIGKIGVRILTGEKPRDIPIGTGQRHFNLYDWRQLKRWGIPERDLPPKSIIRYRESTFYEIYYWYIWEVITLIMFETLLIYFLLINRSRRRGAERKLQKAHRKLEKVNIGLKNEITERERTEEALKASERRLGAEIEDRKRIHSELDRSEKRFRAFMDHTPASIYIKDESFKLVYGNQFVLDYLGLTDDQFIGTTSHDHFPPDIANHHEEIDWKILEEGIVVEGEPWQAEIGGKTRWWYDVKFPLKLETQEYLIGGISFDITDLKSTEQALNERLMFEKLISELSRTFINLPADQIDQQIDDGFELIAKQLDIDRVVLLQFSQDKSELNLTHSYAIDSRHRAPIFLVTERLPWFSKSLSQRKTLRISKVEDLPEEAVMEKQYMEGQGIKSFLTILMIISESVIGAISYSDMQQEREWSDELISQLNVITAMFASAINRSQTEKELHESEERYRALVNGSPAAILLIQDGHFIFSNPAGLRLLGFSDLAEIVGRPTIDVVPPAFHELVVQRMESLTQEKSNPTVELELLKTDGTTVAVETTSVPIQINRQLAGLVICNDITQRKKSQEALLKSQEDFRKLAGKLLSAQESERRMLAREMHDDLTQRLAVLAIDIGKIERDFQNTEDPVVEHLQRVREGLVNLSGDIHAISRQLHPSILEDLGLVDAVKSECISFTRREGIAVDYHAENVPSEIPPEVAICIYRIVQEGLRNVAKHSGATQLQISLTGKDDSIHLTIKDQGAGFDLKETEKKPGLGLVSMQERVRLILGNISIESRPGKGTVINVRASLKDS